LLCGAQICISYSLSQSQCALELLNTFSQIVVFKELWHIKTIKLQSIVSSKDVKMLL